MFYQIKQKQKGAGVGEKPDLYLATLQRCMSRTFKEVFFFFSRQ